MSSKHTKWAYDHASGVKQLKLPERAIFYCLAYMANHKTGEAFPSSATIAAKIGCSVRTVDEHRPAVERSGIVRVRKRPGQSTKFYFPTDIGEDGKPVAPPGAAPTSVRVTKGSAVQEGALTSAQFADPSPGQPPQRTGATPANRRTEPLQSASEPLRSLQTNLLNQEEEPRRGTGSEYAIAPIERAASALPPSEDVNAAREIWDRCAGEKRRIKSLPAWRSAQLASCITDRFGGDLVQWEKFCCKVASTDWLDRTDNGRTWVATLDWCIKAENITRIMESERSSAEMGTRRPPGNWL